MKLLLAQQPFLHELINQTILEVHSHWLSGRPFVAVVVLCDGIIPVSLFARIADELKQADRTGTKRYIRILDGRLSLLTRVCFV